MQLTMPNQRLKEKLINSPQNEYRFTAPLTLNGDPVDQLDAATKRYVDTKFQNLAAPYLHYGVLSVARLPVFTGDLTNSEGMSTFTLSASGAVPGTHAKVTVNEKGLVIHGEGLAAADIPEFDWALVNQDRPTLFNGYGITDAIDLNGDSIGTEVALNAVPTEPRHAANKAYLMSIMALGLGVPVGTTITFTSPVTPEGFLRTNGGWVSTSVYVNLFAEIGDKYGLSPDGSQFKLPDNTAKETYEKHYYIKY